MPSIRSYPSAILIQENSPAPFSGALLPIDELKELQRDHLNLNLYKQELTKQQGQLPVYEMTDTTKIVVFSSLALIIGFVSGALIK
jgi:hypothetical protein